MIPLKSTCIYLALFGVAEVFAGRCHADLCACLFKGNGNAVCVHRIIPAFLVSGYTFPLMAMANLLPFTHFLTAWR